MVEPHPWKICFRQLGWWHSLTEWENHPVMFQSPPTSYGSYGMNMCCEHFPLPTMTWLPLPNPQRSQRAREVPLRGANPCPPHIPSKGRLLGQGLSMERSKLGRNITLMDGLDLTSRNHFLSPKVINRGFEPLLWTLLFHSPEFLFVLIQLFFIVNRHAPSYIPKRHIFAQGIHIKSQEIFHTACNASPHHVVSL